MATVKYQDSRPCARNFCAEQQALDQITWQYNPQVAPDLPTYEAHFPMAGFVWAAHPDLPERHPYRFGIFPAIAIESDDFDLQAFIRDVTVDRPGLIVWQSATGHWLLSVPVVPGTPRRRYEDRLNVYGVPFFYADHVWQDVGLAKVRARSNRNDVRQLPISVFQVQGDRVEWLASEDDRLWVRPSGDEWDCPLYKHKVGSELSLNLYLSPTTPGVNGHVLSKDGIYQLCRMTQDKGSAIEAFQLISTRGWKKVSRKTNRHFVDRGQIGRWKTLTDATRCMKPDMPQAKVTGRRNFNAGIDAFQVPSDMMVSLTDIMGTGFNDGKNLMVLGLNSDALNPVKFVNDAVIPEARDAAAEMHGFTRQALHDATVSQWNSEKGRLFIHMADDAFRFLFALPTLITTETPRYDLNGEQFPAFYCFYHREPIRKRVSPTKPVFRGLGKAGIKAINAVPGLASALEAALNDAHLQVRKARGEGVIMDWNQAFVNLDVKLPAGHFIATVGAGWDAVQTVHNRFDAGFHLGQGDRDGFYGIQVGVGASRYDRKTKTRPLLRLRDAVLKRFADLPANQIVPLIEQAAPEVCNGVQRTYLIENDVPMSTPVELVVKQRALEM